MEPGFSLKIPPPEDQETVLGPGHRHVEHLGTPVEEEGARGHARAGGGKDHQGTLGALHGLDRAHGDLGMFYGAPVRLAWSQGLSLMKVTLPPGRLVSAAHAEKWPRPMGISFGLLGIIGMHTGEGTVLLGGA